jgi:hypothetical protein
VKLRNLKRKEGGENERLTLSILEYIYAALKSIARAETIWACLGTHDGDIPDHITIFPLFF